jgi:hypothetical protein
MKQTCALGGQNTEFCDVKANFAAGRIRYIDKKLWPHWVSSSRTSEF